MGFMTMSVTNILLLIGIILIGFTLLSRKNTKETVDVAHKNEDLDQKLKEMEAIMESANKSVKDLNELHAYMMNELSKKQNELMLLYEILDEKEKRIKEVDDAVPIKKAQHYDKQSIQHALDQVIDQEEEKSTKDQVLMLSAKGLSVDEIAKQLHIGKREAKLFVDLNRQQKSS